MHMRGVNPRFGDLLPNPTGNSLPGLKVLPRARVVEPKPATTAKEVGTFPFPRVGAIWVGDQGLEPLLQGRFVALPLFARARLFRRRRLWLVA